MNPDNSHPSARLLTDCVSVVVPVYNETAVLPAFYQRVSQVLASINRPYELIFVNDGSSDGSLALLKTLREQDKRVGIVDLSRNYGKEVALSAGLDCARGAAIVIIDADLQDPPELIPELILHWQQGYDVVAARRIERKGETWLKKATAFVFYRVMRALSPIQIPADTGDFRLLSRRAVEALRQLREQHRFMKGLFVWIGYPQTTIFYRRDPRQGGQTKWNYLRLWNFALEGITSFSIAPLKLASYVGLLASLVAFVYALIIIWKTLAFGEPVRGYPSLMVVVLFLGGIQLLSLGIIGEYLGRIFNETKQRPLYFLNNHEPAEFYNDPNDFDSSSP